MSSHRSGSAGPGSSDRMSGMRSPPSRAPGFRPRHFAPTPRAPRSSWRSSFRPSAGGSPSASLPPATGWSATPESFRRRAQAEQRASGQRGALPEPGRVDRRRRLSPRSGPALRGRLWPLAGAGRLQAGQSDRQEPSPRSLARTPLRFTRRPTCKALAGETITYDWILRARRGLRHMQTTLSPLRGPSGEVTGIVGVGRDVSLRVEAGRELQRWARIFEHAGWGVAIVSADGRPSKA